MGSLVLIVPGRLEARTGGSIYDLRMAESLRVRGWSVAVRELDDSFPLPTPAALDHARRVLAAIPDGTAVLIDGLALGAMPMEVEREAARLRIVALVHLPLADEIGLDRETAARFQASERRALAATALVVVTGHTTATALAGYGVGRDRIAVVEPGTDRAPIARGSRHSRLHLLSVATLSPGKGHEILFRALAAVSNRDWRLTCAGSVQRHRRTVDRLLDVLRAEGLEDRVSLVGELDAAALAACYDSADVFVLATLHETYGMAAAEALARGLPVVGTTTGAMPALVGDNAGLLVPPGAVRLLAVALSMVVGDVDLRERLAAGARLVRERLPTWEVAAGKMADALGLIRGRNDRRDDARTDD
jgi:glycosyltransferase involved in cell wall biosynthesis